MAVLNANTPIGSIDRRVTLVTRTYTQSASGAPVPSETTQTVWAQIKWKRGYEKVIGAMESNNPEFMITIRYKSGVTEDTIVRYDGEDYDITYIGERDRRRWLDLECVKREA